MKREYIISFSLIFGVIPLLVVAAIVAIRSERDYAPKPNNYIERDYAPKPDNYISP